LGSFLIVIFVALTYPFVHRCELRKKIYHPVLLAELCEFFTFELGPPVENDFMGYPESCDYIFDHEGNYPLCGDCG